MSRGTSTNLQHGSLATGELIGKTLHNQENLTPPQVRSLRGLLDGKDLERPSEEVLQALHIEFPEPDPAQSMFYGRQDIFGHLTWGWPARFFLLKRDGTLNVIYYKSGTGEWAPLTSKENLSHWSEEHMERGWAASRDAENAEYAAEQARRRTLRDLRYPQPTLSSESEDEQQIYVHRSEDPSPWMQAGPHARAPLHST